MAKVKAGTTLSRDGLRWLVTETVSGVGGATIAQLECLDNDARAGVDVAILEAEAIDPRYPTKIEPCDVKACRAEREKRMRVPRLEHKLRIHDRQIQKAETFLVGAKDVLARAERAHSKGELRTLENRTLIPGRVARISPEEQVAQAKGAVRALEERVEDWKQERDGTVAELAAAKKGGAK
jgi:hypothetical protein